MDGFVQGNAQGTGRDAFAAGYYLKQDIPFLPHAAKAFNLYDRWFCSIMASTYPNRHYQWGTQNGGQKSNVLRPESEEETGFTWETIFDRAIARGLTARYYNSDSPFAGLYGRRGLSWTVPVAQFYADAVAGRLPNIAFVDPAFLGAGRAPPGTSTRTATSAWGRRSCWTSSTRSWSRPSTGAGRCSSTASTTAS